MSCRLGITSMSLGWAKAGHELEDKLRLAHKYGYKGIELFHDDLDDLAARRFERKSGPVQKSDPNCRSSHAAQMAAAAHVRTVCEELDLTIICLQPFMGYEGLLDKEAQRQRMDKLHRWIKLAHVLNTDIIQIPSSFEPAASMTDDRDVIVSDLQRVADVGAAASPPLRFVFEALCWGTRADLWEDSWEIVKGVDRPNFGLCLDSFNIAGRIYADPASPSGTTPDAAATVEASMRRLAREVDASKVFYVQIVDAERLSAPLVEGHAFYSAEQPKRMSWSRNCRLFYGEQDRGAYLPVRRIAEAFFRELGFKGWVSLELFNRRMSDEGAEVPEELARRGAASWRRLVRDLDLDAEVVPVAGMEGTTQAQAHMFTPTPTPAPAHAPAPAPISQQQQPVIQSPQPALMATGAPRGPMEQMQEEQQQQQEVPRMRKLLSAA